MRKKFVRCLTCNKKIEYIKGKRGSYKQYCNKICYYATPIKKPGEDVFKCEYCGLQFFRYIHKNYQRPRFCSRVCSGKGRFRLSWWRRLLKRIWFS